MEIESRDKTGRRSNRWRVYRPRRNRGFLLALTFAFIVCLVLWGRGFGGKSSEIDFTKELNISSSTLEGTSFFSRVSSTDLILHFPADFSEIIAVGFHQASNPKAHSLEPIGHCFVDEATQTVSETISKSKFPVLFVMNTRGRGGSSTSAADVAVKPGTLIRSPVDGVVTKIKTYYLYGKNPDYHVEIEPRGHPELRVAMIHLDELGVKVGSSVKHEQTVVGKIRRLSRLQSQINRYLPEHYDHVHIQVNPYEPEEE